MYILCMYKDLSLANEFESTRQVWFLHRMCIVITMIIIVRITKGLHRPYIVIWRISLQRRLSVHPNHSGTFHLVVF